MKTQPSIKHGARLALVAMAVVLLPKIAVAGNWNAKDASELIADINAANLAGGVNSITLAPGKMFTLTAVNNTADGPTGLPVVGANNNLTIRGNGATLARSSDPGTPAFRFFDVASGATLTLDNLILANGLVIGDTGMTAFGGAVVNETGGTLNVTRTTFVANQVVGGDGAGGPGGFGLGGAVYSDGIASFDSVVFRGNQATGGATANHKQAGLLGIGSAGALSSQPHGVLTVRNCWFIGNRGVGGQRHKPSAYFDGVGGSGAIDSLGTASIIGTVFTENKAIGGAADDGVNGGYGIGGALGIGGPGTENATCDLRDCKFNDNQAIGGGAGPHNWGGGSVGGAISHGYTQNNSTMTITRCVFTDNRATGGTAGFGGFAEGGAINNESSVPGSMGKTALTIRDSIFTGNQAEGSNVASPAWGGAIEEYNWIPADGTELTLAISNCTFACNEAVATPGSGAFNSYRTAVGGALSLQGNTTIQDSTFLTNRAVGAASSPPAAQEAYATSFGGGVATYFGTLDIQGSRFEGNQVIGGDASLGRAAGSAVGGGVAVVSGMPANIVNSSLLNNIAAGGAGGAKLAGGEGIGGGLAVGYLPLLNPLPVAGSTVTVTGTMISNNQALGGSNGGTGMGGGYAVGTGVLLGIPDTSTVTLNGGSVVTNNVPDDVFHF